MFIGTFVGKCARDPAQLQISGMALAGIPAVRAALPWARCVILVTAPALTGAGAIAGDRQSEARSVMG